MIVCNRSVAADAGVKAEPCSLCTGKSSESFIKSSQPFSKLSATVNSTEMPDSSDIYSVGEWRKQNVSLYTIVLLFLC